MTAHRALIRQPKIGNRHSIVTSYPIFLVSVLIAVCCLSLSTRVYGEELLDNSTGQPSDRQEEILSNEPGPPDPTLHVEASRQEAADQEFLNKRQEIIKEFSAEKGRLAAQVSDLESEIELLEKTIQGQDAQVLPYSFLLELTFLVDWGLTIVLWFFPIMILNHFLYSVRIRLDFVTI
jgi:hypothetical protein